MKDEMKDGLWYRCREFVDTQSAGEWSEKQIADDADLLMKFVQNEIRAATPAQSSKGE